MPMEKLAKNPELPFDKAWIKQGVDFKLYRTLYIAPVNTDDLKKADWWKETVRAEQIQQDVQNLAAVYADAVYRCLFRMISGTAFGWSPPRKKCSLTLALAITELVPSHVVLNALK